MLINKPVFKHYNLYFFYHCVRIIQSVLRHILQCVCVLRLLKFMFLLCICGFVAFFFRSVYRLYQLVSSYLQHEIVKMVRNAYAIPLFEFSIEKNRVKQFLF